MPPAPLLAALPAIAQFATPLITSALEGARAKKLGREVTAANNAIPMVDPDQARYLAQIQRRQNALASGTDPMTAARKQAINNAGFQTQMNIARAGGGSGASTVSNLLRAQNQMNAGIQEAGALASNRADQYQGQIGQLNNSMEMRKYALQTRLRDQKQLEYATAQQGSRDNLYAAIAALPDFGSTLKQGSPASAGVNAGVNSAVNSAVGSAVSQYPWNI